MNFEDRLIADAQWVLKKSWSVRFIIIAAFLSGLEVVVPLFSDTIPRGSFATLSFIVTAAAFVARFVAQSRDE